MTCVFAVAVSALVSCTNCFGVGSVSVVCPDCSGKGIVKNSRFAFTRQSIGNSAVVGCRKCMCGLYRSDSKGSGKVKKTCPVCKGKKKIKGKNSPLTANVTK